MGNFFGNIYYLFVGLFGQHLSDYLWGYNCQTGGYDATVVYLPIGLVMTILTTALFAIYYFAINHPRLNKWWHWLITGCIILSINLLIGGIWVNYHLQNGLMPNCLVQTQQSDGSLVTNITGINCWMFGLANGIVAFIWFFILSTICKRWSRNCRHTPWRSIFPKRNK